MRKRMKKSRRDCFEMAAFIIMMIGAASAESDSLLVPLSFMAAAFFVHSIPTMLEKSYDFLVRREEAKSWR